MSVLIIGKPEEIRIKRAIAEATANPVRWETMKDVAISPTLTLSLDEKKRMTPGIVRPASQHLMLGNIRVAYSHEEQPAGMFRHISASVRRPGKVPNPIAMATICEAFGFSKNIVAMMSGAPPEDSVNGHFWLEEFDPGHHAINVIELIEITTVEGTA